MHTKRFSVDVMQLAQEGAIAAYHTYGMTDEVWSDLWCVFDGDRAAITAQLKDL